MTPNPTQNQPVTLAIKTRNVSVVMYFRNFSRDQGNLRGSRLKIGEDRGSWIHNWGEARPTKEDIIISRLKQDWTYNEETAHYHVCKQHVTFT